MMVYLSVSEKMFVITSVISKIISYKKTNTYTSKQVHISLDAPFCNDLAVMTQSIVFLETR